MLRTCQFMHSRLDTNSKEQPRALTSDGAHTISTWSDGGVTRPPGAGGVTPAVVSIAASATPAHNNLVTTTHITSSTCAPMPTLAGCAGNLRGFCFSFSSIDRATESSPSSLSIRSALHRKAVRDDVRPCYRLPDALLLAQSCTSCRLACAW